MQTLSELILQQTNIDLTTEAAKYVNENVKDADAALQGARDIISETINEDDKVRAKMRRLFEDTATLQSKVLEDNPPLRLHMVPQVELS